MSSNNEYKFIFIIACNLASPGTDSERQQNDAVQQCEYLYEIHLLCPAEIVSIQQVNKSAFLVITRVNNPSKQFQNANVLNYPEGY